MVSKVVRSEDLG